jgi:hypothetical protein
MNGRTARASAPWAACALLCLCPPLQAQTLADASEFFYHTMPRDTLIGIARRLLQPSHRWTELQQRNQIADPRRIPRGATLRIPYAWLRMEPEAAVVSGLAGSVLGAGRALSAGQALSQGSLIETGADGSITLQLADGSVLTLQKSSALRLEEMQRVSGAPDAHDIRLQLQSGRLETVVKPHRDVGRFEIVTPVAVSAVRGTQFRAALRGAADIAATETLQGSVQVSGRSGAVAVAGGFGTRVEGDTAPLPPVPLLPAPDLSRVPPLNNESQLELAWPAVAMAAGYRLQLSADADFHAIALDIESSAPAASLPMPPDGRYWLRARSIDRYGLEGPDTVRALEQHLLAAAPQLISPQPRARLYDGQDSFRWRTVPQASAYRLQIAHDADFLQLAMSRDSATPSLQIQALAPGEYFWRVAGLDAHSELGAWSAAQSFAQHAAAPLPTLATTHHALRLEWFSAPLQPGQRYRLQVARGADFTRPQLERLLDETSIRLPGMYPGVYYARLQIVDADGEPGPFSPAQRFEVPAPRWVRVLLPVLAVALLPLL